MLQTAKKIHIIGIGGIGVSALAKFLSRRGVEITGSDLTASETTEELELEGKRIFIGHDAGNVPDDCDLIIYSPAVPVENPERVVVRERGVAEMSYPEALGELSKEFRTIAVAGTNGKSTTTAMLGLILEEAGFDPTVIVGTKVPSFKHGNMRIGKTGSWLVVEACEYREHFLNLFPEFAIVTNIEEDHLDYFRDLNHIREAFQKFVDRVPEIGRVIFNADDETCRELNYKNGVSFGTENGDYRITNRIVGLGQQTFEVWLDNSHFGDLVLQVPASFNAMNALAATALALSIGVPFGAIQAALEKFFGVWRRFERVGKFKGADVFSDYGHHPTAIRGTLEAAREFFPGQRIVLCFQPHQHERTKTLFNDFVEALAGADILIIPEIFAVAGRTENFDISSRDLVEAIKNKYPDKEVIYASDLKETEKILSDLIQDGDALIIQGAGDVDNLARKIVL
ncbi:MAG: UDP-N-acetylmuramate--L-alanine ligase [Candidatus Uhrbacteria bacterium]